MEKKHQIEDIGVQTDQPNRRYSIVNWDGVSAMEINSVNIFYLTGLAEAIIKISSCLR